jgi:SAM-dependent methyltransferase
MGDPTLRRDALIDTLRRVRIIEDTVDAEALTDAADELAVYARHHARAFGLSLALLARHAPARRPLKVLELGAAPYYFTALVHQRFGAEVTAANVQAATWPGTPGGPASGRVLLSVPDGGREARLEVPVAILNIEKDPFPFEPDSFDVVLCMEVLEHLAYSPSHMLAEAHRVLKPDGLFLLTVPNLLTIKRQVLMFLNRTTEVPYSGYGLYGRHQREFAPHEVRGLLLACHYDVLELATANVWPTVRDSRAKGVVNAALNGLTRLPIGWLAAKREYVLAAARPVGEPVAAYPGWLYTHRHLYPAPPHGIPKQVTD